MGGPLIKGSLTSGLLFSNQSPHGPEYPKGAISNFYDTGDNLLLVSFLVYIGEQLIAGVVDYGGKHKIANISANFHKKSRRPEWEAQRLGVN